MKFPIILEKQNENNRRQSNTSTNFNLKSRFPKRCATSYSSLRYSYIWAYFASLHAISDLISKSNMNQDFGRTNFSTKPPNSNAHAKDEVSKTQMFRRYRVIIYYDFNNMYKRHEKMQISPILEIRDDHTSQRDQL